MTILIATIDSYGRKTAKMDPVQKSGSMQKRGKPDSALSESKLLKIITDTRKNNDIEGWFYASYLLGNSYMDEHRYSKAHDIFLSLAKEKSSNPLPVMGSFMPNIYANLATTFYIQGNFTETISTLNSVNEHLEKKPRDKLVVLLLISNVWANMPEMYQPEGFKKALFYLEMAEDVTRGTNNMTDLAMILNNEGDAYVKLKNWKKCEEKLNACITLCRKYNLPILNPALITLGEAYYAQGKFDLALFYLKEVHKKKSSENYYIYCTVRLAETYIRLSDYEKAAPLLAEAGHMAKNEHRNSELINIYRLTSDIKSHQGNDKEALAYYKMYNSLQDSLNGKEVATSMQALDLKYRTSEANRKLLERQLFIKKQGQLLDKKNSQIMMLVLIMIITTISILALYSRIVQKRNLLSQRNRIGLLMATVAGEEKERQRIAQELHDGIGGMLAVVNMNLLTAQKYNFKNENQNSKILQMISDISTEVRRTAHNLLPTALDEHDLVKAIRILCDEVSNGPTPITIDLEVNGDLTCIDRTFNTAIYRIVQELLQNTIKHSEASHIVIIMEKNEDEITLDVEDNGKGYDMEDLEKKCLGMRSIKKRVSDLGGTVRLDSEIGIGTSTSMFFKYLT